METWGIWEGVEREPSVGEDRDDIVGGMDAVGAKVSWRRQEGSRLGTAY